MYRHVKMHIHSVPYIHILDVYVGIRLYLYADIGVIGCGGQLWGAVVV